MKYLLAALFIASGILHFAKTGFYLRLMPRYLPYPKPLVLISGAAALLLGLLLLFPETSRLAAWGLAAYLVAVFPANLHMALHPEVFPKIPAWLRWARLPLQGILILWALRYTRGS